MTKPSIDKATPRPWRVEIETEDWEEGLRHIYIREIGRCFHDPDWAEPDEWERDLANAELIVEAVNSYDQVRTQNAALREALQRAHNCATLREDGTCDGCFVSEVLEEVK